jgi:hypothetical protein
MTWQNKDIHSFLLPDEEFPLGFLPQSLVILDLIVLFLTIFIV